MQFFIVCKNTKKLTHVVFLLYLHPNMKNTSTYIVVCPHCGTTKRVAFSPLPWSNEKAPLWSDGHVEFIEWCEPAWTQQCPSCKHFFILPAKSTLKVEEVQCDDTGVLSYQTLKQAIKELSGDKQSELRARMDAWRAYNELYRDVAECEIPSEERIFNRENMQWLLNCLLIQEPCLYSLIFELYRLLGHVEEYKQLLLGFTFEKYKEWRKARFQQDYIDDERSKQSIYERFIKDKRDALNKPLRPYRK